MKLSLGTVLDNPIGKKLIRKAGVPEGAELRRGRVRGAGPVVLASVGGGELVEQTLSVLGVDSQTALVDVAENRTRDDTGRDQAPRYPQKVSALLLDATELTRLDDLEQLRAVLRPMMRGIAGSGRIIIVGRQPDCLSDVEARVVQTGLDGITRSVGKELRGGATCNLLQVSDETGPEALRSTVDFLLDGRSAFVDGQVWRIGSATPRSTSDELAFADRIVVVTGAARGIGADIARTFARDGARVVAVDVPAGGEALAQVANEIGGSALQLDITRDDAGQRIAAHVAQHFGDDARIHALVHNAGITRDRMLANLDEKTWGSVLEVNLASQLRMNSTLLDATLPGGLADGGRIVGVSSTSGIAGNKGQTNYAASKAGVVGMVRAMAPELAGRGITINAVAPGFIETVMTAKIPYLQREIFRRTNSLQQGGKPVDVAETIAYFADPASQAVTGQVVRVCGQNLVGQ